MVSLTATGLGVVSLTSSGWWWALAVPLTIASSIGTLWALGPSHATRPSALVETPPTALLVLGSSILLRQMESPWQWVGLGVSVLLLVLLLLGRYYSLDPKSRLFGAARFSSSLVAYMLALGYFAGIYGTRARSLESATTIALVAFLLALYTLGPQLTRRSWLAAGVSGMMMGEVTWGLNYWPMNGLIGGLFLLLVFYGLTGTLHNYLLGRLNRGILLEFLTVVVAGLTLLAVTSIMVG